MEFDWDNGNLLKSLLKHGISREESEQVFDSFYLMEIDEDHSAKEVRFRLIGKTDKGTILYVIFTSRKNKIRIISARMADRGERGTYEKEAKKNS